MALRVCEYKGKLRYAGRLWMSLTDHENYVAFRSMPGGDYQGTVDMFYMLMAEMAIMFGTRDQKLKSLYILKNYIDKYWGAPYLCTDALIFALSGLPPHKTCRALGYTLTDVPDNRELAIEYYKKMIDNDIEKGDHHHAKCMAENFEDLLGIHYFGSNMKQTSKEDAPAKKTKKKCYIATCVYGSYDCPQVWTLRRYRDTVLAGNVLGRLFIRCYYAISPHAVSIFGKYSLVRNLWKKPLDKFVRILNSKGYPDTPYEDS